MHPLEGFGRQHDQPGLAMAVDRDRSISTGFMSKSTCNPTLAQPGWTGDEQVLMSVDPTAIDEVSHVAAMALPPDIFMMHSCSYLLQWLATLWPQTRPIPRQFRRGMRGKGWLAHIGYHAPRNYRHGHEAVIFGAFSHLFLSKG